MDIHLYEKRINEIENKYGDLIDKYYQINFPGPNQQIFVGLLNDVINLMQDIIRDKYLYDASIEDYQNGVSFQPSYYSANIYLRSTMIFERIVFLIAISFHEDIRTVIRYKNIDSMYKVIKKNKNIPQYIKKNLFIVKGDYIYASSKEKRNKNEHSLSEHLDKDCFGDNVTDSPYNYDKLKNKLEYSSKKQKEIVTKYSKEKFSRDKLFINKVYSNMHIYETIIEFIINYMKDKIESIIIDDISAFRCDYIDDKQQVDLMEISDLEKKYLILRETVESIINRKNKFYVDLQGEKNRERNMLLVDFVYRMKEIVRSLCYNCIAILYYDSKELLANFSIDDFQKYVSNDLIGYEYYLFYPSIKIFSIKEKIVKFLCYRYNIDTDKLVTDKLLEKLMKYNKNYDCPSITILFSLINSPEYSIYENFRNVEYHFVSQKYFFGRDKFNYYYLKILILIIKKMYTLIKLIVDEEERITIEMIEKCPYKNYISNV